MESPNTLSSDLEHIDRLLVQCHESLTRVEHISLSGMIMRLFICNPDVLSNRAGYSQASLALQRIELKARDIPNPLSWDQHDPASPITKEAAYSSWRCLQDFPYAKTLEALNNLYGGPEASTKLQDLKQHLTVLKAYLHA